MRIGKESEGEGTQKFKNKGGEPLLNIRKGGGN